MESSACSTLAVKRYLAARPPSVEDSPTLSTRKLSSSRLPSSSSLMSHWWSPYTTDAAWSARRWSVGFLWVRTAAERKSKVIGRKWRNQRGHRSAGGTRSWSPRGYQGSLQVLALWAAFPCSQLEISYLIASVMLWQVTCTLTWLYKCQGLERMLSSCLSRSSCINPREKQRQHLQNPFLGRCLAHFAVSLINHRLILMLFSSGVKSHLPPLIYIDSQRG